MGGREDYMFNVLSFQFFFFNFKKNWEEEKRGWINCSTHVLIVELI
jgi:hypothetical protein